jgi:hypothetical protein
MKAILKLIMSIVIVSRALQQLYGGEGRGGRACRLMTRSHVT